MYPHQLNLDSSLDADELFRGASRVADSPGVFFACGRYVLEAVSGREPGNILISCACDSSYAARELATLTGLRPVLLNRAAGVFNLVGCDRTDRSITVVPLSGKDIGAHLERSGFTVEAMAVDLASRRPRELIDPSGGLADLREGRLKAASYRSFADDPARLLLAAELAGEYGLEPETETAVSMRAAAGQATSLPPGRCWRALARLFGGRGLAANARFLAEFKVMEQLIPEVGASYGVPQNYYHHLGVWEHTLEALETLEGITAAPGEQFPAFGWRVGKHLERNVEGGVDRRAFLGFAALIHDIGKPGSMSVEPSGRIRFPGHQERGCALAAAVAERLGLGRRGSRHLCGLVSEHMRLGFLMKEGESAESRLRAVYELGDRCVDVVVLSLADRMATRGEASMPEAQQLFKRMASRVLQDYFWNIDYPPLVSGYDVAVHAGVPRGPEVGRLLFKARVAQRESMIASRQQALEYLAPDFKGKMDMPGR